MDFNIRCMLALLGLLAIAHFCSALARSGYRSGYRSYSYRSYGSSGVDTSDGGFIAGMVILGVGVAVLIAIFILCYLKKKGTICSPSKVTSTHNTTLTTVDNGFDNTGNYSKGFNNPPPPPQYSDVYPPAYDAAYPPPAAAP